MIQCNSKCSGSFKATGPACLGALQKKLLIIQGREPELPFDYFRILFCLCEWSRFLLRLNLFDTKCLLWRKRSFSGLLWNVLMDSYQISHVNKNTDRFSLMRFSCTEFIHVIMKAYNAWPLYTMCSINFLNQKQLSLVINSINILNIYYLFQRDRINNYFRL